MKRDVEATSRGDENDAYAMFMLSVAMDSYAPMYIHRTIHEVGGN